MNELSKADLGQRIRVIRNQLKKTQTELGGMLRPSVSGATISAYENGDIWPSLPAVVELARIAGVTYNWLLTGVDETTPDRSSLSQEEKQLIALYDTMSKNRRRRLLEIAEDFAALEKGGIPPRP